MTPNNHHLPIDTQTTPLRSNLPWGVAARVKAATHIALQQQEAFGPNNISSRCIACTAMRDVRVVELTWSKTFESIPKAVVSAVLHMLTHICINWQSPIVAYNTYHALCDDCIASLKRRRILGSVVGLLGTLLLVAGMGICLGYLIMILASNDDPRTLTIIAATSFTLAGGGFFVHKFGRRMQVPDYVCKAGPFPFQLVATREVSDSVKNAEQKLASERAARQNAIESAIIRGNLYQIGRAHV